MKWCVSYLDSTDMMETVCIWQEEKERISKKLKKLKRKGVIHSLVHEKMFNFH